MSLWDELRNRRVVRVGVVYAAVGWALVEAADTLVPRLGIPDWVATAIALLVVLGFPVAVALAWAFDWTPEGVKRAAPYGGAGRGSRRAAVGGDPSPRRVRRAGWFAFGFLVALTTGWIMVTRYTGGEEEGRVLDGSAVAVLPFRVAGADPSMAFLQEGMVDLLAAKFTGAGGLRAADPQAVLSSVRSHAAARTGDLGPDHAGAVAASIGAGLLLTGSVVGTPSRIVLSASLHETAGGRLRAQASVEGPADSLSMLVDRLAASLLSLSAGEAEQRLSSLTSTSLPSLQAYLDGRSAYRRSRFDEAIGHFKRAVEQDSAFTLAWLGLQSAASWQSAPELQEARAQAWRGRERLSPRDRALLMAYAGARYPLEPSPVTELVTLAEEAVRHAPDRPDAWYLLGDRYFHSGALIGAPDPLGLARANFERAVELDSTFLLPLVHLVELAAVTGDRDGLRRFGSLYLAADSGAAYAPAIRWTMAYGTGDEAELGRIRQRLPDMPDQALISILGLWRGELLSREDADTIVALLESRTGTRQDRLQILGAVGQHRWLRGHASALSGLEREFERLGDGPSPRDLVTAALFWRVDFPVESAIQAIERGQTRFDSRDPDARHEAVLDLCVLEQWRLSRGDTGTAAGSVRRIRAVTEPSDSMPAARRALEREACALMLDGLVAAITERPDAYTAVDRLDRFLRVGPAIGMMRFEASMTLPKLWEWVGEPARALDAVGRIEQPGLGSDPMTLLQEGRLAALVGERDRAVRAYRSYLALRPDPEPPHDAERETVSQELARLLQDERR
jgi:tetratricopeptide (TPR) repeat protein